MRKLVEKTTNECEAAKQLGTKTQTQADAGTQFTLPQTTSEEHTVTFVEGKGFHAASPPVVEEKKAINRICTAIGYAILAYLFVEYVLSFGIVQLMELFDADITYYYDSGYICGNRWCVLLVLFVEKVVKYLIPIGIIHRQFHMPLHVALPTKVRRPIEFAYSIPMILIVFAVSNFWYVVGSASMARHSTIGTSLQMLMYTGRTYQILYLFFDVLVVSCLISVLLRGELLQVLRQFGNGFAVLVTSILGAFMMHDLTSMATLLLIYLICGFAILRSGSIWTGIVNFIIYRLLLLVLFQMESAGGAWTENRWLFLLGTFFIGVVCLIVVFVGKGMHKVLEPHRTVLTMRQKITALFQNSLLVTMLLLCLALAVFRIVF